MIQAQEWVENVKAWAAVQNWPAIGIGVAISVLVSFPVLRWAGKRMWRAVKWTAKWPVRVTVAPFKGGYRLVRWMLRAMEPGPGKTTQTSAPEAHGIDGYSYVRMKWNMSAAGTEKIVQGAMDPSGPWVDLGSPAELRERGVHIYGAAGEPNMPMTATAVRASWDRARDGMPKMKGLLGGITTAMPEVPTIGITEGAGIHDPAPYEPAGSIFGDWNPDGAREESVLGTREIGVDLARKENPLLCYVSTPQDDGSWMRTILEDHSGTVEASYPPLRKGMKLPPHPLGWSDPILVMCVNKTGFIYNVIRSPGDVFWIAHEQEFSSRWMRKISDQERLAHEQNVEVRRRHSMAEIFYGKSPV